MLRIVLISLGVLSVVLGVIGIFVPGLPTTAFLLAAAALFSRSSPRFHAWLLNSPLLGKYIRNYHDKGGISRGTRIYSIIIMWVMIGISGYFFIDSTVVRLILLALGLVGTIVMGFIVPSAKE